MAIKDLRITEIAISESSPLFNDDAFREKVELLEQEPLDNVVSKVMRDYGYNRREAEELRHDFLRYMSLIHVADKPIVPPKKIDNFWHCFILHTRDYMAFCERHFDRYIHHQPLESGVNEKGFDEMARLLWEHYKAVACCCNTCQADWNAL